ncbi:peptidylprolyl isomerase [Bauldia sp.]|uniref:peptidylprolyl isomerase n=1 Tax=Bauldia sp. TaxID=2575872 RepID=UPI003BAB8A8A
MNAIFRTLIASAVVAFATTFAIAPATAASTIRIKVDDQPITSYDIRQRTGLFRLTGVSGGEKAAIQELIDETLQFIEAAKRGISIPESRVDVAIASIAQRVKMTPDALAKALSSEGVDIKTLRRRIKAQITWQRLVDARMRFEGASVSGSDVTAALFADNEGGTAKTTEYTLQQIIFVVPNGASSAVDSQRRREAEAFRSRFPGCEGSVELAKQLKGVVVKSLGRRTTEQLDGPDGDDIRGTPVGRTTRPMKSDGGYDLIAVCATRDLETNAAARVQAENKLIQEKNQNLGKEYLAELREKAVIEYR